MAELNTLGITVEIGQANVERLRQVFPDISIKVEQDLSNVATSLADVDAFVGRARHVELLSDATRLRWVQTLRRGSCLT